MYCFIMFASFAIALLHTDSTRIKGKPSHISVKPVVVVPRDFPSAPDSSGPGTNVIHAPLPEHPADSLKKPHNKLPSKKQQKTKKHKRSY